jgi:hypothetical protein
MDVSASFARQRKSLLITSGTLLAYVGAGVSLEKLSILGNTFTVSRPGLIPLAMWVVWGYFVLRYYQLYRDLDDKGPGEAHQRYLDRRIIDKARKATPKNLGPQFLEGLRARGVRWTYSDEQVTYRDGPLWHVSLSASARTPGGRSFAMQNFPQTIERPGRVDRAYAWLSVAVHTRFFTEYGLPVLVGLSPVVAWVVLRVWNH